MNRWNRQQRQLSCCTAGGERGGYLATLPGDRNLGLAYVAPQAAGNTWYPIASWMPIEQNEPFLSSALATVGRALDMVSGAGIPAERIILLGFSQGACLASEFVARNARRYGGLIVFSGGVIGPDGTSRDYPGSLGNLGLGCSDIDPHVPIGR